MLQESGVLFKLSVKTYKKLLKLKKAAKKLIRDRNIFNYLMIINKYVCVEECAKGCDVLKNLEKNIKYYMK